MWMELGGRGWGGGEANGSKGVGRIQGGNVQWA